MDTNGGNEQKISDHKTSFLYAYKGCLYATVEDTKKNIIVMDYDRNNEKLLIKNPIN